MSNKTDLPRPEDTLNHFGDMLAQLTSSGYAAPNNILEIKQEIAGRLRIKIEDFDTWLEALIDLCSAGRSYFEIELQTETTRLKELGYKKRKREKQCIIHDRPVYGLKVRSAPTTGTVYRGFVNAPWDTIRDGDEVYIDHYQYGLYPRAAPKIAGPYTVVSARNRYLYFPATGNSFTYIHEHLLKKKETAG